VVLFPHGAIIPHSDEHIGPEDLIIAATGSTDFRIFRKSPCLVHPGKFSIFEHCYGISKSSASVAEMPNQIFDIGEGI
jgi:hypothetical protein